MPSISASDFSNMKVQELKTLLAEKGLVTTGKKNELVERLVAAFDSTPEVTSPASVELSTTFLKEEEEVVPVEDKKLVAIESVAAPEAIAPAQTTPALAKPMTEAEKIKARKEKFGIKSQDDILDERARRFGLSTPNVEKSKKDARAMRFGLSTSGSSVSVAEEEERRKKRADRFGLVDEATKRQKRSERFGNVSEEDKRNLRLQRFSQSAAA